MSIFNKLMYNAKLRAQIVQRFAIEQGLEYKERDTSGLVQQLRQFRLFKRGSRKIISNVVYKNLTHGVLSQFDYQYTISTGKTTVTYRQTVFFIESKDLSLPQFYQKPEDFFTRLTSLLGFQDIDFANFKEYSQKFHLVGEYESVIRFYFSESVLQLLSRLKNIYMEGMNYYFILYDPGALQSPEDMKEFLNLGVKLFELFKTRSAESEQAFRIQDE